MRALRNRRSNVDRAHSLMAGARVGIASAVDDITLAQALLDAQHTATANHISHHYDEVARLLAHSDELSGHKDRNEALLLDVLGVLDAEDARYEQ